MYTTTSHIHVNVITEHEHNILKDTFIVFILIHNSLLVFVQNILYVYAPISDFSVLGVKVAGVPKNENSTDLRE